MEKEYGGYLPLELSKGQAYYHGENVVALNSGRYAAAYAVRDAGWNCIYLPYYICNTVREAIQQYFPDISIRYYHIDRQLLPINVSLQNQDGLLWVNYFGIQAESVIDRMADIYRGHLIIDNTQAFFTPPRDNVWQIYSCRKFFGVCDGGYAIHKGISRRELPRLYSSAHASHLLYSLEQGTNSAYSISKENEERLGQCGMASMSPLTAAILNSVDYQRIRHQRRKNMEVLHSILREDNQLSIPCMDTALSYPFLCEKPGLRDQLVCHKIYVPRLWDETYENPQADPWEVFLSEHLCILPIDQRYNENDMQEIGLLVLKLIENM